MVSSRPFVRQPGSVFASCAAAFVVAAAVVAAVHATTPITRGWWLVAYLALVGGAAQLLLGTGLVALVQRLDAWRPRPAATRAQLVLWNAGTVIVAVADLAELPAAVLAGSVLLVAALGLFAASLRRAGATARRPAGGWALGYVLLLLFLGGSVVVGAGLAGALPG